MSKSITTTIYEANNVLYWYVSGSMTDSLIKWYSTNLYLMELRPQYALNNPVKVTQFWVTCLVVVRALFYHVINVIENLTPIKVQ